jgi:hypothetical protein
MLNRNIKYAKCANNEDELFNLATIMNSTMQDTTKLYDTSLVSLVQIMMT